MYFSFYKNYSKIFQGILENPWKILEILKSSSLALIDTSLENVHLDIALRFKVFQGQLKFSLEIFGLPSTLKILEIFEKGHLDLELTLNFKVNFKDPWNSRLRFPSLIFTCQQHDVSLSVCTRHTPRDPDYWLGKIVWLCGYILQTDKNKIINIVVSNKKP